MKHIKKITLAAALPLMMFASLVNSNKKEEITIDNDAVALKIDAIEDETKNELGTASLGNNFVSYKNV